MPITQEVHDLRLAFQAYRDQGILPKDDNMLLRMLVHATEALDALRLLDPGYFAMTTSALIVVFLEPMRRAAIQRGMSLPATFFREAP